MAAARTFRSRPACITVWSGLTSAATEWPFESQAPSSEPGSTSRTLVPRSPSRRRCSHVGATVVTSRNPLMDRSSSRRPSSSSALGHSCPASDLREPGAVHVRGPGQRWGLAVEDAVTQPGDPVQPWSHQAPEDVPGPAAPGHRGADELGQLDHGSRVRLALGLVAVEHRLRKVARQDAGQLPAEVHGVAQPRTQALTDERRGEVRRVAEQEDVAVAPVVGDLGAERVLRGADQPQLLRRHALDPRADRGAAGPRWTRSPTAVSPSNSRNSQR